MFKKTSEYIKKAKTVVVPTLSQESGPFPKFDDLLP